MFSVSGLPLSVLFMEYYLLILIVPLKVYILGETQTTTITLTFTRKIRFFKMQVLLLRGYLIQETILC